MDDKKLDNLFREKLYPHSSPVEEQDALWKEISASLDRRDRASGLWRRKRLFYAGASVVAVLIVALYLFAPSSPKPYIPEPLPVVAETVPVEKLPETATNQPFFKPEKTPMKKKPTIRSRESLIQTQTESDAPEYVAEVGVKKAEEEVQESGTPSREASAAVETFRLSDDFEKLWDEVEEKFVGKKKTKYLLAIASNFVTGSNPNVLNNTSIRTLMAAGAGGSGTRVVEQVSETKYSLPLNLGLQFQIRLNSILSVGTGVNYSMLRSKYDGLIDKKMHSVQQTLHYIGVPVNLYATVLQKNGFSVYANVGGAFEKGIRASYAFSSYDGTIREHASVEGVQFSVNFGLGAEYRFIRQLGVYLEPNAVYFFNSKIPNSIRTDQPFQLKAEIGFRFHL